MKIAITGSSGFLGENLISSLSWSEIVRMRIRNNESFMLDPNVGTIVHLAGKAHNLKNVGHKEEYYQANFQLTKQLFDAFLQSAAKKFIFISTVKAVADSVEGVLTEDIRAEPRTHYGMSKLMAEEYIQRYTLPEGKAVYILRPCMIHGPGNQGNLNLLYRFVSKGIPYPLAAFANKRSFVSIDNICFIIKEILQRDDIPSGIYNIADDEPLSTSEVVEILSSTLSKTTAQWRVPKGLITTLAKVGDLFRLPLNSERLQKLTENYVVSNVKIRKAIGKSLPLSAREGIRMTGLSFKGARKS